MQFTAALLTSTLAGLTLASPVPRDITTQSAAADTEWALRNVTRQCDDAETMCAWNFGIDTSTNGSAVTLCPYMVSATPTANATAAPGGPVACGVFTVTSSWSGQFGDGTGFTTFAVVDYNQSLIAYPSYTDVELANGTAVTPDRSYPVQTLVD